MQDRESSAGLPQSGTGSNRLMRLLALGTPSAVLAIIVIQVLLMGLRSSYLSSWAALAGMSAYLGLFLHRRSRNLEAAFFSTRLRPTDDDGRTGSVEAVAMGGSIFLVALTLLLPWLRA